MLLDDDTIITKKANLLAKQIHFVDDIVNYTRIYVDTWNREESIVDLSMLTLSVDLYHSRGAYKDFPFKFTYNVRTENEDYESLRRYVYNYIVGSDVVRIEFPN